MKNNKADIFFIRESADKIVCPPEQVFKNIDFEFLFTTGGHLVDNNEQYLSLLKVLIDIGENEFTIRENLGATLTERNIPFEATFSVNSQLDDLNKAIKKFDPYFGMIPWHFFVYGHKDNWGIYVAEFPTIIIIGCTSDLVEKFRKVYGIRENGYKALKPLLDKEFAHHRSLYKKFKVNYKIKTTHHNMPA
jgi:hypothetical protein